MDDLSCNGLNATECLLRVTVSILEQLKEDSSAFNWDPASFVVTLVIGIIAAAFAFFAIIQGFLAAGPGRHKCSKYAIGTWARLSKRNFDWSELRYRSVTQTPVITVTSLLRKMEMSTSYRIQWRADRPELLHLLKLKHVQKSPEDYFPATWLRLLTYTKLHHPELWYENLQGTDYLPSDLAAAPAYSTIADLIIVTSIAGGKMQLNLTNPDMAREASIRGKYMTINFREHPLLGLYAAIDEARLDWGDPDVLNTWEYRRPSAEMLFVKIAYSQGLIPCMQDLRRGFGLNTPLGTDSWVEYSFKFSSELLINDIFKSSCSCGSRSTAQQDAISDDGEMIFEWCQARKDYKLDITGWLSKALHLNDGGISILAAAAPPFLNINLFPSQLFELEDKFLFLMILSRRCMKADVSMSQDIVPETSAIPGVKSQMFSVFSVNKELWYESCKFITALGRPEQFLAAHKLFMIDRTRDSQKNDVLDEIARIDKWVKENSLNKVMVCRIMALALTAAVCKCMYHGNQRVRCWPTECDIAREERRELDEMINDKGEITPIPYQPSRIWFLSRGASVDKYFTVACLSPTTGTEKPFRFLEYMEHVTKLWEKDGDDFKYPTDQVQHYLDDLLIYRATLICMWISQAADNSHILTNPYYYKLIPVI
ncbi:hypothetical protein FOMG_17367 [Fusarium oxysporum f. sp. melonis 26406]|uniref:Uncharacterized protein n=1 Tax=Fusarium oxysporum f. sp. melonis 26406 TaxID=1089452 RepID=W9ZBU3_FUSOX|nr:hypothetical protein FOMG_17367 [Fusarium oxysporum f. sp. melonis 26406]